MGAIALASLDTCDGRVCEEGMNGEGPTRAEAAARDRAAASQLVARVLQGTAGGCECFVHGRRGAPCTSNSWESGPRCSSSTARRGLSGSDTAFGMCSGDPTGASTSASHFSFVVRVRATRSGVTVD